MVGVEMIARSKGYRPFHREELDLYEPTMVKPDSALGWIPKTGAYLSPLNEPGRIAAKYTFLEDSSRAVSAHLTPVNYDLILLGCSFTLGWGISDEETFAWKLQNEFPSIRIGNFGVGGYGTYQSLLMMRKLLNRGMKPRIIVHGFNTFHEDRDIAPAQWIKELSELTQRKHFAMPYCSLDKTGKLQEHPPYQWPTFPLQKYFAFPQMLIDIYYKLSTREDERWKNKREITKKILLEMRDLAKENNVKLVVVIFEDAGEDLKFYSAFLKTHGIETLNANFLIPDDYYVPIDGHPNGKAHSVWAEKIAEHLKTYAPFREILSRKA